uniref:DUF4806 domain-containing protein n=1 Tax=Schizaphis graminum TaxID=13262 RepID=A0A2S2NGP7_SCHGA
MMKSDISSTEDEVFNVVPKYNLKLRNPSPERKSVKKLKRNSENQHESSLSGPPQYNRVKDTISQDTDSQSIINQITKDSDSDSSISSGIDDSDQDLTWKPKLRIDSEHELGITSPIKVTPLKPIQSPVVVMTSPSGPWRVSLQDNKKSVNKSRSTNKIYLTELKDSTVNDNSVKRQLQYPVENKNITSDLYNISLTSFSFLKYEIQALKVLCHSMNENIEKMMNHSSETTFITNDVDIESLFPIKNHDDLIVLDSKINDTTLRKSLVSKISLFVGRKDIRNSVRRIMARMFDDTFLVNYSLYGFKQKQSFSNLACYRLIIDALRQHIKYKMHTDKEIDEPLGIRLSHAPYRLIAANKNNSKEK